MRVGRTILLLLSVPAANGCYPFDCASSDPSPGYHRDFWLSATDVAEMAEQLGLDPVDLTCEAACQRVENTVRGVAACTPATLRDDDTGAPVGSVSLECDFAEFQIVCEGRRPVGRRLRGRPSRHIGAFLANAAEAEAASVPAFLELRDALASVAPDLAARCARAARDERRHAAIFSALAAARGAPTTAAPPRRSRPDLFALMRHNATEGCVAETWAALCAVDRARNAPQPVFRRAYRAIAADELAHAELAWDIHRWAISHLPRPESGALADRQRAAAGAFPAFVRRQARFVPRSVGHPARASALARDLMTSLVADGRGHTRMLVSNLDDSALMMPR